MPGPEDKVKYPPKPKFNQKELNKDAPKTRRDIYGEFPAPPTPTLDDSQFVKWIESGGKAKEEYARYVMMPPPELPYRKLPVSTKFISTNTRHLKEIGAFRTILPELFGDAGYKAVDDAYASFAYSEFNAAKKRGQLTNAPNCSIKEIGSFIATVYDIQNFPIVIAEATDERVRIQLYKGLPVYCPYDVRRGDYRLCSATAAYERELVKLCNPKFHAYLSRTKAIGDDCCELTIEVDPSYKAAKKK
ncbi:MAG: hypothetical protein V1823_05915 [Chloroflexota bacterium]